MSVTEDALRACDGDEVAFARLYRTYEGLLYAVAREFFAPGLTLDDLLQAGRIGLYKATVSFDPARGTFEALAPMAIRRQVITEVKTAQRAKHSPLNGSVALHAPPRRWADADVTLADILPDGLDPLTVLLAHEELRAALGVIADECTELERAAVLGIAGGRQYGDIAAERGCSAKRVDNAAQRARKKVRRALAA